MPWTPRRVAALVASIAALAAAVVLWIARPGGERTRPGDRSALETTPADAAPPSLAASPSPAAPSPDPDPSAPPTDEDRPGEPGTLVVSVLSDPDGGAIPGAQVVVRLETGKDLVSRSTDGAGVARFERLASDRVAVEARAAGRVPETTWVSELNRPVERRVTIRLEPGIALEGIVLVAGTTRPLPGARVLARRGGSVEGMSVVTDQPPLVRTATDESGLFRVEGIPLGDVVSIDAAAPGFVPATKSLLLGEGSKDHPRLEIRLDPAAVVAGRVVDRDGRPAAAAEVVAVADDVEGRDVTALDARIGPWGVGLDVAGQATTDDDGYFVLDGLRVPATLRLFARKAGQARSALSDPALRIDAPARVQVEALVLRRPAALAIRVVDPAGTALPDARVWIDLRGIDLVPEKDAGGIPRFTPLPAGTYEVSVARAPFVATRRKVVLSEGSTLEERVVLERGVAIEGVVVDDVGTPLPRAGVTAYPVGPDAAGGESGASADEQGRFRVEGLRSGPYSLVASAAGHGSSAPLRVLAPGTGARFVLRRSGSLRLRLVLPAGASPPARVTVNVEERGDGGGVGSEASWNEGRVEVRDLTSARVRLAVGVPGFAPVVREEEVTAGGVRDLGDVRVDEGVELSGRVVDAAGSPRAGARVRVLLPGFLSDAAATTGADGAFRIPRLPPGERFVRIEAEGCVPGAERVALGPRAFVTFTLVPGVSVRGTVKDAAGAPARDVRVVLRLEGESPLGVARERSATTDASGAFTVLVAAGSHRVVVEGDEGAVLLRLPDPVVVPRESPLAIELP